MTVPSSSDNRRRCRRTPLSVPVMFGIGMGTVRDISSSGLYFETCRDHTMNLGDRLRIEVDVSTMLNVSFIDRVIGEGRIVRIDTVEVKPSQTEGREQRGVAVEFDGRLKTVMR